jgi:hypothetical protein
MVVPEGVSMLLTKHEKSPLLRGFLLCIKGLLSKLYFCLRIFNIGNILPYLLSRFSLFVQATGKKRPRLKGIKPGHKMPYWDKAPAQGGEAGDA